MRPWYYHTMKLWFSDSMIPWDYDNFDALTTMMLSDYDTVILWGDQAMRLCDHGGSMRVRKSKNRGVLKDSETVSLGFYKTMDYDTLMLWYDEVMMILWVKMVLYLLLFWVCVCMLSALVFAYCPASPFFLASFLHSSEQDQRTTEPREGIPGA